MRLLARIVDIRTGEASVALRAFLVLFGIIAGHTVLETTRDAMFLGALPANRLTLVYLALAALGLVVPSYNARFVRAFGRRNAVIFTLVVAAFGTMLWHFQPSSAPTAYGLYIWSGLVGTVLVVQFWMYAAQLFTITQGKRLFAGIAAGGVMGATAGGAVAAATLALVERVTGSSDVRLLLLLPVGLFIGAAMMLTSLPVETTTLPVRGTRRQLGATLDVLRDHPYVPRVALQLALATATLLSVDYLFKWTARDALEPSALGSFFAIYYTALNGIALLIQIAVAQRLVQRVGVVAALALLPVLILLGASSLLVAGPVLALVLVTKGADGALRHSVHRVVTELLYLPLPAEVRDRAKALLEAVCARGAQALMAGALLLIATAGYESIRSLAIVVGVLSAAWLIASLSLRSHYLDLFRDELGRGGIDPQLLAIEELDLDSVESVMAALSSPDARRVVAAMNLLVEAGRARLIPALVLYHEAEEVLIHGLDIVARLDGQDWKPHARRLLRHDSVPVRAAALRALGRACDGELVRQGLHDKSPAVRAHAAFQLAQCEGADTPLTHPAIVELMARAEDASHEERVELRLGLLEALERDADERWVDVLLALAASDDARVIASVARAMARIPDERFVPHLVRHLSVRQARGAVHEALLQHARPALEALAAAMLDPATPARVRRIIPLVIAGFGTQRAVDELVEQLRVERDGATRYRVLRGLTRIVAALPSARIDRAVIEQEMDRNLSEHLRVLGLRVALGRPASGGAYVSGVLLRGLLEDKARQAAERAFRLFKLLNPREDVRGIFRALSSSDRYARANALEFLEALALDLGERCRNLLRTVADELPDEAKVQRSRELIGDPPEEHDGAILRLLDDADEEVAAMAAYHAFSLGDQLAARAVAAVEVRPSLGFVAAAAPERAPGPA